MRFKMMAAVAMAALTVPAFAQTSDTTVPPAKPKKEKKVCREQPQRAGSNFVTSICKTKAEWAAIDKLDLPQTTIDGARSSTDAGNLGPGVR